MTERPELTIDLDAKTFREYYYLKSELVDFLREHGLPTSGGKEELNERIALYLETGKVREVKTKKKSAPTILHIDLETKIEENFVCSELHRAFFKKQIGSSFSFNVAFQKWLKSNAGKTYQDAVDAYHQILAEKKTKKTNIDKQFEYNTYIRDFFAENKGRSLEEAIRCWNYKKQAAGHHRYEASDLVALEK